MCGFIPLMNLLSRLLRNPIPTVNLYLLCRNAIFWRSVSVRSTRDRRFFSVTLTMLRQGSVSLLLFHLSLVFDVFELMDLLEMLLRIRLVSSLSISTPVFVVIMELLLYWPPKLHFLVEVILNISFKRTRVHRATLEAYQLFVLLLYQIIFWNIRCYGSCSIRSLWQTLDVHINCLWFCLSLLRLIVPTDNQPIMKFESIFSTLDDILSFTLKVSLILLMVWLDI